MFLGGRVGEGKIVAFYFFTTSLSILLYPCSAGLRETPYLNSSGLTEGVEGLYRDWGFNSTYDDSDLI